MKVLYEKDAVIKKPLPERPFNDIYCPSEINHPDSINDENSCLCMQSYGWQAISHLSDIKHKYQHVTGINYYWIKGIVNIEGDPSQYYGLFLKYLQGRDIVYINNRLVWIKPAVSPNDLNRPSQYRVPAGLLKKGKNIVHMRLEIVDTKNSGVGPDLFLLTKTDYNKKAQWHSIYLLVRIIPFFIIGALLLYCVIQAIIEESKKIFVLSAMHLSYYLGVALLTLLSFADLNLLLYSSFFLLGQYFYSVMFILFFQFFYGIKLEKLNKTVISIIIIMAVLNSLVLIFRSGIEARLTAVILTAVCGVLITYALIVMNRKKPGQKKIYIFLLISLIYIINIIFRHISSITELSFFPYYMADFLYPVYIILFPLYGIVYNSTEIKRKRKHFNQEYNAFIKQKIQESRSITITDSSEKKLGYIVEFINENYTEDLSREGLASLIGMSPNYFSSLFNKYTGKKIQEYINMLRIKRAVDLMNNSDKRIIDIAYSVGFTNLATFISSFKKVTGQPPQKFRRDRSNNFSD